MMPSPMMLWMLLSEIVMYELSMSTPVPWVAGAAARQLSRWFRTETFPIVPPENTSVGTPRSLKDSDGPVRMVGPAQDMSAVEP